MLLHNFQINTNCLYICQSVSWLTSLLKLDRCRDSLLQLDKYRDFSSSESDIYLKFSSFCQSVSWLTSLLQLDK